MSEYQYYEFMAIDRSLTRDQMAELRSISSRAEITPTRFTNSYSYGDFRGDPFDLVERFFDAHVYIANWGTHILMFGLPASSVDAALLLAHSEDDGLAVRQRGDRLILSFELSNEDGGGGWVEDDEGASWMASLVSLRADLMNGDLRAAYLGWLRGIQTEGLYEDDEEIDEVEQDERYGAVRTEADDAAAEYPDNLEMPVPAGLGSLTASLESLVRFLEIDEDLVAVAAEASASLTERKPSTAAMQAWVSAIPSSGKDALLLRALQGDTRVQAELLRRFRAETAPAAAPSSPRRTVRQLLQAAQARTAERKAQEAEAHRQEQKRRLEQAARAREHHLASLAGQEHSLWLQVEQLIASKQQKEYDRAVTILRDLRDLAQRAGTDSRFQEQVSALRERHHAKPSLMKRLDLAKLG
ncbi:MAG: hypothetical protein U0893_22200 [Chloroflexota bacterium]